VTWTHGQPDPNPRWRLTARQVVDFAAFAGLLALVAASAVVTKELTARTPTPALAMVETDTQALAQPLPDPRSAALPVADPLAIQPAPAQPSDATDGTLTQADEPVLPEGFHPDTEIRYFNGRPVRPIKRVWMTVTAYSPDERSCGDSADNITASNHHVYTNAHRLVAADTRILPLGSIISIPGYDDGQIVPVLDRGGAIKGMRLDVLYPTHERARKWGVQRLPITIWGYADGLPPSDYRKERDSKR
jgi:3D (Asp-Asp-Asp) domain-containing protein